MTKKKKREREGEERGKGSRRVRGTRRACGRSVFHLGRVWSWKRRRGMLRARVDGFDLFLEVHLDGLEGRRSRDVFKRVIKQFAIGFVVRVVEILKEGVFEGL